VKTDHLSMADLVNEATEKVTHVELPETAMLARQDEVWVTEQNETYGWWRGRVRVKGGHKYFTMRLPIEGDRMVVLREALEAEGIELE